MAQTDPPARLEARVPAEVHALLKRAADLQGRTMTDFVVATAVEEARRVISEHDVIRLSLEDQRAVAEALANPPEPTDALRRAFARRRDLLGLE
jgi:uncharacterized protein (DUF1778 family)